MKIIFLILIILILLSIKDVYQKSCNQVLNNPLLKVNMYQKIIHKSIHKNENAEINKGHKCGNCKQYK
jgi:hypothetical protein